MLKKTQQNADDNRRFPFMSYPLFDNSVQGVTNGNYTLPIGTRVVFDIEQNRNAGGGGEQRTSILTAYYLYVVKHILTGKNFLMQKMLRELLKIIA